MGKNKRALVPLFKEFLRGQERNTINEDVNIEVEWWDDCIAQVIQELKEKTEDFSWESLISYAKNKFSVLGQNIPIADDEILIELIKSLIFQFHGDSLVLGSYFNSDNEDIHAKGVVIEELARVILDRIKEITEEGEKETRKTELCDRERTTLVPCQPIPVNPNRDFPDENCEELPVEYECKVVGFDRFSKLLEEATECYYMKNYENCIQDAIDRIATNAGGTLDLENILKQAKKEQTSLYKYVWNIAEDTINRKAQMAVKFKGNDYPHISYDVLKQAMKLHIADMVQEIIEMLKMQSGMTEYKIDPNSKKGKNEKAK